MENEDTDTGSDTFMSVGIAVSKLMDMLLQQREAAAGLGKEPEPKLRQVIEEETPKEGIDGNTVAGGDRRGFSHAFHKGQLSKNPLRGFGAATAANG